jgi:rfaE bifunctional protein kinase chain/domain
VLSDATIEAILTRLPSVRIGVVGDLFLDKYLDLDDSLTEPSLETGLDAYQVVNVRTYPGAAGTVLNNLVALGVGRVATLSVVGDDGEGYELLRELRHRHVDCASVVRSDLLRTPTYVKPMLQRSDGINRELHRLDVKNRQPLASTLTDKLLKLLPDFVAAVDAVVIVDQVSEADCGVVSAPMRAALAKLGEQHRDQFFLADSRERIGLFRSVATKPNQAECLQASDSQATLESACQQLAQLTQRPVFCTRGHEGLLLVQEAGDKSLSVAAYPVAGSIDPVGAGDSTSAGIAVAMACGCSLKQAAAFGNLVASITIQQIGTTGVATAQAVRDRWQELHHKSE